jgi:hypothetical protein
MLTYLTYADHMLEIVKILVEIPEIAGNFSPQNLCATVQRYLGVSLYRGFAVKVSLQSGLRLHP